jgi:signal transduction histidine kinase
VADGVALVVEDEGVGFAASGAGGGVALAADSRGIGLRLALARSLMEAHGGRLEVEALAKVGSRISLIFPAARLRPESSE